MNYDEIGKQLEKAEQREEEYANALETIARETPYLIDGILRQTEHLNFIVDTTIRYLEEKENKFIAKIDTCFTPKLEQCKTLVNTKNVEDISQLEPVKLHILKNKIVISYKYYISTDDLICYKVLKSGFYDYIVETYNKISQKMQKENKEYKQFLQEKAVERLKNRKERKVDLGIFPEIIKNPNWCKQQQGAEMKEEREQQEQNEQPQDDYYLRMHDKGKPKILQVPVEAIQAISEVMDYGSQKYGANTWQQVEIERYLQAGARHLYATQKDIGAKDEESGKEHLKHALCNLAYAVALYEMKKADNEK